MNHRDLKDKLSEYRDGELSGREAKEVQAHLEHCAECRVFLDGWARISKGLFAPDEAPAHAEVFVRQVMGRIEAGEGLPASAGEWRVRFRRLVPAFGIAAALFLAVLPVPQPMSAETLLMNGRTDADSQWFFSNESSQTDEVLELLF